MSNVVTVPTFRGRGLARGCLEALVEWFRDSTAVHDVNLSATADGSMLYHRLGFAERAYPSMRLTIDRTSVLSPTRYESGASSQSTCAGAPVSTIR